MTRAGTQIRRLDCARVCILGQALDAYLEQSLGASSRGRRGPWPRRRGDIAADRLPSLPDVRPVRHGQVHRGPQRVIPVTGRAVGRHRHRHRTSDERGPRRAGGCRTRPDGDRRGRRPEPEKAMPDSTSAARGNSPADSRRRGAAPEVLRSPDWPRAMVSRPRRFRG
jgi:hypothetical protein